MGLLVYVFYTIYSIPLSLPAPICFFSGVEGERGGKGGKGNGGGGGGCGNSLVFKKGLLLQMLK